MSTENAPMTILIEQPKILYDALAKPLLARRAAVPAPSPIPVPVPLVQGTRVLIWKQDPSVSALGVRAVYIPTLVLDGPHDARITTNLAGTTPVVANINRDFIFVPGSPEFDCAHAFTVVRETLTMYQRLMGAAPLPWVWNKGGNTDPISVFPRAGVTPNAFYSRSDKALKFFYFTPSGATTPVFTCRSLDIVAHECGHAVLDGLRPGWLGTANPPQTGGLHESFGDLTALFLACAQLDQVEAAIAQSKGDLHKATFLAALAEQFGSALGFPHGLRNADNDLKLSQVSNEVHAISQVQTGAVYDILADIFTFEKYHQAGTKDPARVLLEVASRLCKLYLRALIASPAAGATFSDVANHMLKISKADGEPPIYRTFIRNRFTVREVVVSATPLNAMMTGKMNFADPNFIDGSDVLELERHEHASDDAAQDRTECCGTMQLPEHTFADERKSLSGAGTSQADLLGKDVAELSKAFH